MGASRAAGCLRGRSRDPTMDPTPGPVHGSEPRRAPPAGQVLRYTAKHCRQGLQCCGSARGDARSVEAGRDRRDRRDSPGSAWPAASSRRQVRAITVRPGLGWLQTLPGRVLRAVLRVAAHRDYLRRESGCPDSVEQVSSLPTEQRCQSGLAPPSPALSFAVGIAPPVVTLRPRPCPRATLELR